MSEKKVTLRSSGITLEALFTNIRSKKGVVVTHPHPLYGGDMYNHVVESVVKVYRQSDHSTLRFNFRGVGGSTGCYNQGVGETEDLAAALSYLKQNGNSSIDLVGYSFGCWINTKSPDLLQSVDRLILISPPVDHIDFSYLSFNPKIQLVITGSEDAIASVSSIRKLCPIWNPNAHLEIINGADHFYGGKTVDIHKIISRFI